MSRAALLAALIALSFFAGITGVHFAYTLTYALGFLLLLAFVWSRATSRRLEVRRGSPEGQHTVGEGFAERFTVVNHSVLPVPYVEVTDTTGLAGYAPGRALALRGGEAVQWTTRGVFPRRGEYQFGPLSARVGDPFGLFVRTVRVAPQTSVVVYPRLHPVPELGPLTSGTSAGEARQGRAIDVPPDISTVREYDPGDGLGRIHWPSSARTGRLISRVYDTRQSADLLLFLDLERGHSAGEAPESSLEYAVSLAASVCHAGLRLGHAVGLVTNDAALSGFGAGRGETQRLRLLGYLATCEDGGTVSLAETITRHGMGWRGRGGIVVVTSNRDPGWIEALIELGAAGQRHLAIVVEPTSFGAPGPALRVSAAWRLALDWWLVRRGDDLGATSAGLGAVAR